jgi:hypothetical protein
MLAKHKVVGSTPITRSTFKPLGNQGLFFVCIIDGHFYFRKFTNSPKG